MDKNDSITLPAERTRGEHLGTAKRGAVQQRSKLGDSTRAIAREMN